MDFMKLETKARWNRILMNPPFCANQAKEHVLKAASVLADGGILVAVLPSSLKGREIVAGLEHEWSEVISSAFKESGTMVNVVILKLRGAKC